MDVFSLFTQTPFTYLKISRGEVYGNQVEEEKELIGVFKLRSGMTQSNNQENRESSATLHAHPEDFTAGEEIVGNGIRYDGKDYDILGATEGKNFHTGVVEHIRLTLGRTENGS